MTRPKIHSDLYKMIVVAIVICVVKLIILILGGE